MPWQCWLSAVIMAMAAVAAGLQLHNAAFGAAGNSRIILAPAAESRVLASAAVHYNRAIELQRADSERATLLRRAIQLDPQLGRAYLSLGSDVRRQSEAGILESLPLLESAVALLPTYAPAAHAYGEALLAARRPVDALQHLEAAAAAMPAHAPARAFVPPTAAQLRPSPVTSLVSLTQPRSLRCITSNVDI